MSVSKSKRHLDRFIHLDLTNPFAVARGDKWAMRPFVKLLWTLVEVLFLVEVGRRWSWSTMRTSGNQHVGAVDGRASSGLFRRRRSFVMVRLRRCRARWRRRPTPAPARQSCSASPPTLTVSSRLCQRPSGRCHKRFYTTLLLCRRFGRIVSAHCDRRNTRRGHSVRHTDVLRKNGLTDRDAVC